MIDTCIIVDAERGSASLTERLSGLEDDFFYISVITASELIYGVHKASDSRQKQRRHAFVEDVLNKFPIIPADLQIARIHAELWADLSSEGAGIGAHDLWIAATCIAYGHKLITDNKSDFGRIKALELI
ncbi:MAG: PIN domain-containing protein [Victivallales bacterium]